MKLTVEQLVQGCQHRDSRAQKQLYEEFAPMMLGVCCRYACCRAEAQDLLHDGFIKVFEKIGQLHNPQALEDWVYHIMVNTAVNHVKRRHIHFESLSDTLVSDVSLAAVTAPLSAEELVKLIQQLPNPYRLVFNLREVEGEEYAAIAARLGVTEVSVRSILSRAKKMLRDRVNGEM